MTHNHPPKEPSRAPRGSTLSCKGWHQEAAMRMLMNNLDPEVGERPQDLVVYGGTGKAARNWECYYRIVESLKQLDNDETLLVQSGKPVGIFRTHAFAPRVLIRNSMLVPAWGTWEAFRALAGRAPEHARDLRVKNPGEYIRRAMDSMALHVQTMLDFQKRGAIVFDYGNNIRAQALARGVKNAFDFPGFVPAFIRPLFCAGRGPFRWAGLSGGPGDLGPLDV